jgi:hypothetical protein
MGLSLEVDVRPQLRMLADCEQGITDGLDLGLHEAADIAADWVDADLMGVLRTQTPYYRLQVRTDPIADGWRVHDSGVVYGPWLEGTSSRNATTRFKGYSTWRRIRQRVEREAHVFVERHIMLALRKAQSR